MSLEFTVKLKDLQKRLLFYSESMSCITCPVTLREDMEVCHVILSEMERHKDSWPFLEPVGRSEFPEYFKVIKKPMDFQTMRSKLKDGK